jgi:beta-glucuronidase
MRVVELLDGVWDFAFLGDVDPESVEPTSIRWDDRMAVPGCFDATPRYAGKRGLVAYRTSVVFRESAPHRVIFGAVHHWCRAFLDGVPIREHAGGFTEFSADIPTPKPGRANLVVLVDNRFDFARSPLHLDYFDWRHFGGISRSVTLHRLGPVFIESVRVVTRSLAPPSVELTIEYRSSLDRAPFGVAVDGRTLHTELVALTPSSGHFSRIVELPDAALWLPDHPHLHEIHVTLGSDDQRERIGVRDVRIDGRKILINGTPHRLLGVNRHEAHPEFGHSVPPAVQIADIQLLREMGCNFVRGSHYPQDPRFLDLCDEAGILVWNESIGWQHGPEHLQNPRFLDAQERHIEEMVAMSANHPSIVMWGILNESASHVPACRPAYARLLRKLRELDPTRLVTFASNHPGDDVCFDLADVVSANVYPGWYDGELEQVPQKLDELIARLEASGHGSKPLVVSEIGAEALFGFRDWEHGRFSEEYQAKLLDTVIGHLFATSDRACGLAIWQFCDCRTTDLLRVALSRPRGFNNKGLVDEYRRPKLAFDIVRSRFEELRSRA